MQKVLLTNSTASRVSKSLFRKIRRTIQNARSICAALSILIFAIAVCPATDYRARNRITCHGPDRSKCPLTKPPLAGQTAGKAPSFGRLWRLSYIFQGLRVHWPSAENDASSASRRRPKHGGASEEGPGRGKPGCERCVRWPVRPRACQVV